MTDKSLLDDSVSKHYQVKKKIGSGAYGSVWECVERSSRRKVAVKKIQEAFRNSQDAQRTYREVALLRAFRRHPNIVTLLEVRRATNNMDLYLVFEHMEMDLHQLINGKEFWLCDHHYRLITYQILKAIKYIHSGGIVHRDLKPSNILVKEGCVVKVGDLGLARTLRGASLSWNSHEQLMTGYVATRWYRPPEILLSSKRYTRGVDIWSVGCILAEMILGSPIFKGDNTDSQLRLVMASIPWPSHKDEDAVRSLGGTKLKTPIGGRSGTGRGGLGAAMSEGGASPLASDLVQKLLVFNPEKRPSAATALLHPYLSPLSEGRSAPVLRHYVTLSLRDDIQLSVDVYRQHLYKEIDANYSHRAAHRSSPVLLRQSAKVTGSSSADLKGSPGGSYLQRNYRKNQLPSLYPQRKHVVSKSEPGLVTADSAMQMKRAQSSLSGTRVKTKVIRTSCTHVQNGCTTVTVTGVDGRSNPVETIVGRPKQRQLYSASLPNLRPTRPNPTTLPTSSLIKAKVEEKCDPRRQVRNVKIVHSTSQDSGYLTSSNSGS